MSQVQPKNNETNGVEPALASLTMADNKAEKSADAKDSTATYGSATLDGIHMDALAKVLSFLDLTEVVQVTAINRKFRFEVAPYQKKIKVSSVDQIKEGASIAKIFPNLREIIFSKYKGMLHETPGFVSHIVPFLTKFSNLEEASFHDAAKSRLVVLLQIPEEKDGEFDFIRAATPIIRLVYTIADGYRSGDLPETLKINDLFCPVAHPADSPCPLCVEVFDSFPIKHLIVCKTWAEIANGTAHVAFDQGPSLLSNERTLEEWMLNVMGSRL